MAKSILSKLPSSKLSAKERAEALIEFYQNAYDIWSTIKGVDSEMLDTWLFLIVMLKNNVALLEAADSIKPTEITNVAN